MEFNKIITFYTDHSDVLFNDETNPGAGTTAYNQFLAKKTIHAISGFGETYIPFHAINRAVLTVEGVEKDITDDVCGDGGSGDCTCSNLYFFYNGGRKPIKCNEEMTITPGTTRSITNSTTPDNSSEDSVAMNATVSNPTSFYVSAGISGETPEIQIIGATDEAQDGDTATVTLTVPSAGCQFVINVRYGGDSPK